MTEDDGGRLDVGSSWWLRGIGMWRVTTFGLSYCRVSVTPVWLRVPPVLPSCSFGSDLPKGTKVVLMKGNLDRAHNKLYGVVESLFFLSQSSTAPLICHQQSSIFGLQTSRNIPISAMSLSTCAKTGVTLYISCRHFAHAVRA